MYSEEDANGYVMLSVKWGNV